MASTQVVVPAAPAIPEHDPVVPTRRWPRRVLIGLNIFVAVCLLSAAAAYGYVTYRFGQIKKTTVAGLLPEDAGSPMNILIVGSDSRAGITNANDVRSFGNTSLVGGQRSDTIMLLHIDPGARKANLMSIPRDLFVPIPGTQERQRINTTFDKGPDLLVRTIRDDLGVEISHYVEVDFNSFRGIVNAVGVVHVYFPTPAKDAYTGLNITNPGCYGLNGDQALALVRSRHFEWSNLVRWQFEGESDLARIRRQQYFIKRMMSKAISEGLSNPAKLNGVVASLVSNVTIDSGFTKDDMLRLARRYRSFTPDQLNTMTLPTYGTVIDLGGVASDVLALKQPEAQQAIQTFLGVNPQPADTGPAVTTPAGTPSFTPGQISIKVFNGSGVSGQAAQVSNLLRQEGYVVTGAAAADSYRYITSVIRYGNGDEARAQYLQAQVTGGAQIQPAPGLAAGELELITGSSWSGLKPPPPATPGAPAATPTPTPLVPAPTTTTTAPPFPGTPKDGVLPPCAP